MMLLATLLMMFVDETPQSDNPQDLRGDYRAGEFETTVGPQLRLAAADAARLACFADVDGRPPAGSAAGSV